MNPNLPQLNAKTRLDGTPEYYIPKKDDRHIIEPGFELDIKCLICDGQGYALTATGAEILKNPLLIHRPPQPAKPAFERGPEHAEATWQRA